MGEQLPAPRRAAEITGFPVQRYMAQGGLFFSWPGTGDTGQARTMSINTSMLGLKAAAFGLDSIREELGKFTAKHPQAAAALVAAPIAGTAGYLMSDKDEKGERANGLRNGALAAAAGGLGAAGLAGIPGVGDRIRAFGVTTGLGGERDRLLREHAEAEKHAPGFLDHIIHPINTHDHNKRQLERAFRAKGLEGVRYDDALKYMENARDKAEAPELTLSRVGIS